MIIVVSPDTTVSLEQADDCGKFHLEARGVDAAGVSAALAAAGAGRLAGDDAFIERGAVERLAEGQVGADWAERFDGMLAYAAKKGWLDDAGAVQAHVEWSA